jgi:hypothetical protein
MPGLDTHKQFKKMHLEAGPVREVDSPVRFWDSFVLDADMAAWAGLSLCSLKGRSGACLPRTKCRVPTLSGAPVQRFGFRLDPFNIL